MPQFDVAHIREQGTDLIIIPLSSAFGSQSNATQNATARELEMRAHSAGLAGTVVLVWESGGRMAFLAPPSYQPFFRSISLYEVAANINKTLSW